MCGSRASHINMITTDYSTSKVLWVRLWSTVRVSLIHNTLKHAELLTSYPVPKAAGNAWFPVVCSVGGDCCVCVSVCVHLTHFECVLLRKCQYLIYIKPSISHSICLFSIRNHKSKVLFILGGSRLLLTLLTLGCCRCIMVVSKLEIAEKCEVPSYQKL